MCQPDALSRARIAALDSLVDVNIVAEAARWTAASRS